MKLANLKKIASICILLSAQLVSAGWSSGGGELLRDQINPWFLRNVSDVKYCILIDEANFGQTKVQVKPRIEKAIEFWKIQFRDLNISTFDYGNTGSGKIIDLEKLKFTETSCSEATSIKFQFGILDSEQTRRLPKITDYVALTVRTDYDFKSMQGKGFIYFAPQSGPLRPGSGNLYEKFWNESSGSRLLPAIIHELGHVFGLQHNPNITMMDEGFVETLVTKPEFEGIFPGQPVYDYYSEFEREYWYKIRLFKFSAEHGSALVMYNCVSGFEEMPGEPVNPIESPIGPILPDPKVQKKILKINSKLKSSTLPSLSKLLGIPEKDSNCIWWGIENNKFVVKYKKDPTYPWILAGESTLETSDTGSSYETTAISIWFTKEQNIIDGEFKISEGKRSAAYMIDEYVFKGNYRSTDSQKNLRLVITAHPQWIQSIGGVYNGEIYKDFMRGF